MPRPSHSWDSAFGNWVPYSNRLLGGPDGSRTAVPALMYSASSAHYNKARAECKLRVLAPGDGFPVEFSCREWVVRLGLDKYSEPTVRESMDLAFR